MVSVSIADVFLGILSCFIALLVLLSFRWLLWVVVSIVLTLAQLAYALYQLSRIMADIWILSCTKVRAREWDGCDVVCRCVEGVG